MEVDRSSHKTALRRNLARLCNKIDSTALALMLYENRVISDCQLDLIFDRLGRRERNVIVLLIVMRKNAEVFKIFCECLTNMDRHDLMGLLNQ